MFIQLFLAYRTSDKSLTMLFFSTKVLLHSTYLLKTQNQLSDKNFLQKMLQRRIIHCQGAMLDFKPTKMSRRFSPADFFKGQKSFLYSPWIPRKTNVLISLQIVFTDKWQILINNFWTTCYISTCYICSYNYGRFLYVDMFLNNIEII